MSEDSIYTKPEGSPDLVRFKYLGDDILIDPKHLDMLINHHLVSNSDYTSCNDLPKGMEGEAISSEAIRRTYFLSEDRSNSEYMSYYFSTNYS